MPVFGGTRSSYRGDEVLNTDPGITERDASLTPFAVVEFACNRLTIVPDVN
jgi:hypothetical protein